MTIWVLGRGQLIPGRYQVDTRSIGCSRKSQASIIQGIQGASREVLLTEVQAVNAWYLIPVAWQFAGDLLGIRWILKHPKLVKTPTNIPIVDNLEGRDWSIYTLLVSWCCFCTHGWMTSTLHLHATCHLISPNEQSSCTIRQQQGESVRSNKAPRHMVFMSIWSPVRHGEGVET